MIKKGPTSSDQPACAFLGKYVMLKTLGAGVSAKVKLAYDPETYDFYAIKIMKPTYVAQKASDIEKEVNILSSLNHPNIVRLIDVFPSIDYVKKNGSRHEVVALVFEHVPGGDLFEYIFHTGRFSEEMARTYFRALIDAVRYCHEQGIAHRDLKPENILFDDNFNLKIADFGFSTLLCGREENGKLYSTVGTEAYMAPEILSKQSYNGSAVDVFACGIILFIMLSRNPPFAKAIPQDNYYKYFMFNQNQTFWEKVESSKPTENGQAFYSPEFKDLINGMLHPEPTMRMTLPEILVHPWYNGPYIPIEELQEEFVQRRTFVDESKEKEKQKKEEYKKFMAQAQNTQIPMGVFKGIKPFRSTNLRFMNLEEQLSGKIEFDLERQIDIHKKKAGFKMNSEVFSQLDPKELLKIVCGACETNMEKYTVSDKKYKIKGEAPTNDGTCSLTILITKLEDEDMCCVEFHRTDNNGYMFAEVVEGLKKKIAELTDEQEEEN